MHDLINDKINVWIIQVGKLIMEEAAKSNLKRVSLELGGKSPLVIFDDFDGKYFWHLFQNLFLSNFNSVIINNLTYLTNG